MVMIVLLGHYFTINGVDTSDAASFVTPPGYFTAVLVVLRKPETFKNQSCRAFFATEEQGTCAHKLILYLLYIKYYN